MKSVTVVWEPEKKSIACILYENLFTVGGIIALKFSWRYVNDAKAFV